MRLLVSSHGCVALEHLVWGASPWLRMQSSVRWPKHLKHFPVHSGGNAASASLFLKMTLFACRACLRGFKKKEFDQD